MNALWPHVHCLAVLQQQGSYTRSAEHLGLSKAAISQRISELEAHVGVPLVRRTTRSVQLTEAGKRLADQAQRSFTDLRHSVAQLQDLVAQPRGLLRITLPVALARQHIVPSLGPFLNRYPDIQLELDLSDQVVPLEREGFDLAIRHTTTPPDNAIAWLLCHTETLLVASPAYLAGAGPASTPSDLQHHRCLHYPRPHGQATWTLAQKENGHDHLTVPIHTGLTANNSEVLREMALQDQGIAVLPDFSVLECLRGGSLVEVLPQWRNLGTFGPHIYALRPYSPHVPQAVRVFVAYIRDSMSHGVSRLGKTV